MKNKVLLVGAVGVMAAEMLSGCQSLEEQIGNQIAESMINSASNGEVKVDFDALQNGKINIQTPDGNITMDGSDAGGGVKITDNSGKTLVTANSDGNSLVVKDDAGKEVMTIDDSKMTVKGDNGETTTVSSTGGAARPAEVPSDLPSLNNGSEYGFVNYGESMQALSFMVDSNDLKATCDGQAKLLVDAGWGADTSGMSMESAEGVIKSYTKDSNVLVMTCAAGGDGEVSVMLSKSAKQ
jgi:hypothetical protein